MTGKHALTDRDLDVIASAIDRLVERVESLGLKVDTSVDWERYVAVRAAAAGLKRTAVHVDPTRGNVGNGNAFYVYCEDDAGRMVAMVLEKRWETEDLIQDFRSHHFFHDARPRLKHYPMRLTEAAKALPVLSGVFSYGGGLWVDPAFRNSTLGKEIRLGDILPKIGRWLCLRNWPVDGHFSLMETTSNRGKWGSEGVGNQHVVPLFTDRYPDNDAEISGSLHFSDRDHVMAQAYLAAGADGSSDP